MTNTVGSQVSTSGLFDPTGRVETCHPEGQSHAGPLGRVSPGGHQDWELHPPQVPTAAGESGSDSVCFSWHNSCMVSWVPQEKKYLCSQLGNLKSLDSGLWETVHFNCLQTLPLPHWADGALFFFVSRSQRDINHSLHSLPTCAERVLAEWRGKKSEFLCFVPACYITRQAHWAGPLGAGIFPRWCANFNM